ncbi:hypothetical protein SK128_001009, partial [Halocaridina rubra]
SHFITSTKQQNQRKKGTIEFVIILTRDYWLAVTKARSSSGWEKSSSINSNCSAL